MSFHSTHPGLPVSIHIILFNIKKMYLKVLSLFIGFSLQEGPCYEHVEYIKRNYSPRSSSIFIPRCLPDGYYGSVQCRYDYWLVFKLCNIFRYHIPYERPSASHFSNNDVWPFSDCTDPQQGWEHVFEKMIQVGVRTVHTANFDREIWNVSIILISIY